MLLDEVNAGVVPDRSILRDSHEVVGDEWCRERQCQSGKKKVQGKEIIKPQRSVFFTGIGLSLCWVAKKKQC